MKRYAVSKIIEAPADTIWGLLTDAAGYEQWNPAVVGIEGSIAPGERIQLTSVVNPKRAFSLEVTAFDEPALMEWTDGMPLGLFKGVRTYTLESRGSATEFSMEEVFSGPLAPLITRMIPDMSESFEQFAEGLKEAAEARS